MAILPTTPTINPTPTPPVTPPTYEQKVANINSVPTTSAADKARAISYLTPDVKPTTSPVTTKTEPTTPTDLTKGTTDQQKTISDATTKINDYGTQLDDAYKSFKDTMASYQNGSIPLTPGEQAQINGLTSQYQQLIEQQKLQNKGAEGVANIRGYQTGAAEYDPTFQAKTIGSIVSAGLQKVADLNTKMASSVAELTQKFKDNNMKAIKDAYDEYKDYQKQKTDALQKTIDSAQKEIDNYYNRTTKPIQDIALEAKKNGADAKTIAAISASTNVTQAIDNASVYLQSATGQLGDYIQYKKDMYQRGFTPEDYSSWKAKDDARQSKLKSNEAYASAYGAAKGKADAEAEINKKIGIPTEFSSTVDSVSNMESTVAGKEAVKNQLSNLLSTGNYKDAYTQIANSVENTLVGESKQRFANARTDYQVLTGLKSAIQAYADAGGDTGILKGSAESISKRLGRVSDPKFKELAVQLEREFQTYRNTMTGAAFSPGESREYASVNPTGSKSLDLNLSVVNGAINQLDNRVKKTIESRVPNANKILEKSVVVSPKEQVDSYIVANPQKAEEVAKLYELPGWTDEDVLEYLNLNK